MANPALRPVLRDAGGDTGRVVFCAPRDAIDTIPDAPGILDLGG